MLQGLKMKKLILLLLPLLFACGTEEVQEEVFTAHEMIINRAEVCSNLDASIRDDLDEASYKKLCGKDKLCEDIESELVCTGDWCVIHHSCRLK